MTKHMHQATPSAPVATFNDAPLRASGITITPRWPWSDKYRNHVRADIKAQSARLGRTADEAYADWYAANRGLPAPRKRETRWALIHEIANNQRSSV